MASDFDYVESAQDALDLLTDFGGAEPGFSFTHKTGGGGQPGQGGTPTVTTWAAVGLIFPYTDAGQTTRSGSLIVAGDQRAYVAAIDAAGTYIRQPVKPDTCIAPDGNTYNVVNVDVTAPNGQKVLYEIQLRR